MRHQRLFRLLKQANVVAFGIVEDSPGGFKVDDALRADGSDGGA